MAELVPKKKAARKKPAGSAAGASNVRSIRSAGHGGGRRTSLGYDPATGEETTPSGYKAEATKDSVVEFDVFATVDEHGYRESRFYTRSVNADGHGERLQVRVPQGIDSQMHAAVAEVPEYKTLHDLVRDAVIHRLEFLQKRYSLGDGARRALELERMMADRERRAQEVTTMTTAVTDLDAKLKSLWEQEDWAMMAEEFEQSGEMLDWLRNPYRERAANVLAGWKLRAKDQLQRMRDALEE